MDEYLLKGTLSRHWSDEVEIAGSRAADAAVRAFLDRREVKGLEGPGVSEFPVMESATVIIALCTVVSTTLNAISTFRGRRQEREEDVRNQVKRDLPIELHIHLETPEFEAFLKHELMSGDEG